MEIGLGWFRCFLCPIGLDFLKYPFSYNVPPHLCYDTCTCIPLSQKVGGVPPKFFVFFLLRHRPSKIFYDPEGSKNQNVKGNFPTFFYVLKPMTLQDVETSTKNVTSIANRNRIE
jgi:hypothetical protein